jgi:hypothetical protein
MIIAPWQNLAFNGCSRLAFGLHALRQRCTRRIADAERCRCEPLRDNPPDTPVHPVEPISFLPVHRDSFHDSSSERSRRTFYFSYLGTSQFPATLYDLVAINFLVCDNIPAIIECFGVFGKHSGKGSVQIGKLLCVSLLSCASAHAVTVIGTSGCSSAQTVNGISTTAQSWSSTRGYSNLAVSVNVGTTDPGASVSAWLTTAVGPGTTIASQVATTSFVAPTVVDFTSPPPATTVFSGLTLGPGTYYLVLSSASVRPGWAMCGAVANDNGVTFNGAQLAFGGLNSGFPPASGFSATGRIFGVQVTGTPSAQVPALGTVPLVLLTLLLMIFGWKGLSMSHEIVRR